MVNHYNKIKFNLSENLSVDKLDKSIIIIFS